MGPGRRLAAPAAAGLAALQLLACSAERTEPEPSVASTRSALERADVDGFFAMPAAFALPSGNSAEVPWRYVATSDPQPPSNWNQAGFDDSSWSVGSPGFSGGGSAPEDVARTPWPDGQDHLWLRKTFTVSANDIPKLVLWARWDDSIEIYINGVPAASRSEWTGNYDYLPISDAARQALSGTGTNTLAVHVHDLGGGRYADVGIAINGLLRSRPRTGCERNSTLAHFSKAVEDIMVHEAIPAGVVAVSKGDDVVLSRGLGWADKHFTGLVPPDAPLRLASVDKVLTHVAVTHLIDEGTYDPVSAQVITEGTRVFPLLVAHGLTPLPGFTPDPRIDDVTIGHLMAHVSGVLELPDHEQFYQDLQLAPGTPTTGEDNLRWTYSMPPEFDPGSCPRESCYNSNGYAILRHVVQTLKGDFLQYLRDEVGAPAGTTEFFVAHERLEGRDAREPWYATFEQPYDRWINLENVLALNSSAETLVRFLRYYGMDTSRSMFDANGNWSPVNNGYGVFFGGMSGTWSVIMQRRWDEVNIAVVFNRAGNYDRLHDKLFAMAETVPASAWDGSGCSAGCSDGARNGDETDVDCGGTSCSGCAEGRACAVGADCVSGACAAGVCEAGLTADVVVTTDWGSGYCVQLAVHNGASSATQGWTVSVHVPEATIYTSWNGAFSSNTGGVLVEPHTWLDGLQPGATNADIGFCANRDPESSALPVVGITSATY